MRSCRSISPTDCWDEARRLSIARRFGSAMISNTDSIRLIYPIRHMPVKVYNERRSRRAFLPIPKAVRLLDPVRRDIGRRDKVPSIAGKKALGLLTILQPPLGKGLISTSKTCRRVTVPEACMSLMLRRNTSKTSKDEPRMHSPSAILSHPANACRSRSNAHARAKTQYSPAVRSRAPPGSATGCCSWARCHRFQTPAPE